MKVKFALEDGRVIELELTPEQEKAMGVKKVGSLNPWTMFYMKHEKYTKQKKKHNLLVIEKYSSQK